MLKIHLMKINHRVSRNLVLNILRILDIFVVVALFVCIHVISFK